jgi:ACS family glucarate transporter-like MFS transporter
MRDYRNDEAPSNARSTLLRLIFFLTVITYLDRLCISAAMPTIAKEFHLRPDQIGWIFSAFTFAYAAFEIPSGWLGDRYGARLALSRIVLWWSFFTILTGAATGFWSLAVIRLLFGAGEAGAFPNIAKAISKWLPIGEQGRGMSVAFVGLATGSAITVPLILTLLASQNWRWTFVECGLLGLVWVLFWSRWFRDAPEEHPAVNQQELALIQAGRGESSSRSATHSVPWRALLSSPTLGLICLMYFAYGYGLYFYLTWLPTYLQEARGFSRESIIVFSALPWVISAPAFWFGGWITDRLARTTGNLKLARCVVGAVGYVCSALTLIVVAQTADRRLAAILLSIALACQTTTISSAWAVCLDVGRSSAGVVTGFMNTVGNLGGAIAPIVVGYAVGGFGSWTLPFYLMAGVFFFGALMWLLIDPTRSVVGENRTAPVEN